MCEHMPYAPALIDSVETDVMKRWRILICMMLGILLLGGTFWGLRPSKDGDDEVPEEFSVAKIRREMDEPGGTDRLFKSDVYEQLTDEQQKQVARNKEEAFYQQFLARVDAYFAADESEREALLDAHLDEMEAEGKWKQVKNEKKSGKYQTRSESAKKKLAKGRASGVGESVLTREQRRAKSESINPDEMARMWAYKQALERRALDRRGK